MHLIQTKNLYDNHQQHLVCKYDNKSCVSWVIQGEPTDNNKIIWEGEAVVVGDEAGQTEDE